MGGVEVRPGWGAPGEGADESGACPLSPPAALLVGGAQRWEGRQVSRVCPEVAVLPLDQQGGRPWPASLTCSIFLSSRILDEVFVVVAIVFLPLLLLFRRFSLII